MTRISDAGITALKNWAIENEGTHARKGILSITESGDKVEVKYIRWADCSFSKRAWILIKDFFGCGGTQLRNIAHILSKHSTELEDHDAKINKRKSKLNDANIPRVFNEKVDTFNSKTIHRLFGKANYIPLQK